MGQQMRVKCPRRSSASSTHLSPLESCTRAAEKVINHVVPLLLAGCLFLWVLFAGCLPRCRRGGGGCACAYCLCYDTTTAATSK